MWCWSAWARITELVVGHIAGWSNLRCRLAGLWCLHCRRGNVCGESSRFWPFSWWNRGGRLWPCAVSYSFSDSVSLLASDYGNIRSNFQPTYCTQQPYSQTVGTLLQSCDIAHLHESLAAWRLLLDAREAFAALREPLVALLRGVTLQGRT